MMKSHPIAPVLDALLFLYQDADYQWFVKMFGRDAEHLWKKFYQCNNNPMHFYSQLGHYSQKQVMFAIYKHIEEKQS